MKLEHVNICVNDPKAFSATLCELFDWHVRWEGAALDNGYTVHVGDAESYLAVYSPAVELKPEAARYRHVAGLNHIGVVVDDMSKVEARVKAAGYVPHNHGDYEPGQRFYFDGPEGIEFEVVSYA